MLNKIFVNLPVIDLDKTKVFYEALGFSVNPQFTDEKAACIVMSEAIYLMALTKPFFQSFLRHTETADATKTTEVLNALAVESRARVDEYLTKGLAAGGTEVREPQDYGWMYSRALADPDGHVWEFFFMDEKAAAEANAK